MKRILIVMLALFPHVALFAQPESTEQKTTQVLFVGAGTCRESFRTRTTNSGADYAVAGRLSYAVSFPIARQWSVLPGLGVRYHLFEIWDASRYLTGSFMVGGMPPHHVLTADAFIRLQYHFPVYSKRVSVGLGPQAGVLINKQKYHFNAPPLPDDPLYAIDGKKIFKYFDFGIQASVMLSLSEHWAAGIEANIGLTNDRIQYEGYESASTYLHSVLFVLGYTF